MSDPLSRLAPKPDSTKAQSGVNKAKEFEKQLQEQEKQLIQTPQQQSQAQQQQQQSQQPQSMFGSLMEAPRKLFFRTGNQSAAVQFDVKETQFVTPTREIKDIGLNKIQLGELTIKEAKTQCMQNQQYVDGLLILTNYQVVFLPDKQYIKGLRRDDFYYVPLMFIYRVERNVEKKQNDTSFIDIYSKDGRVFRFKFERQQMDESFNLCDCITRNAFTTNKASHFAFTHHKENPQIEQQHKGWQIFNIQREFERQQIYIADENSKQTSLFKYYKNDELCSTYYHTLVVPFKAEPDCIQKTGKFRSKERIPILSYAFQNETKIISLWRSSQCRVGIGNNRSTEDEFYLKYMSYQSLDETEQHEDNYVKLRIFDARPQINAIGNQVAGKGYENTMNYRRCSIDFLDIHNIHKVRDSHVKIQKAALSETMQSLSALEQSGWYDHIVQIIQGACKIAKTLTREKINVLVHCSDGWDRTAQLVSLAQVFIDPYFRTIEGQMVLIQKEWVFAGHQFSQRSGFGPKQNSDEQRAPIFLQYIDILFQLTQQYPLSFQWNQQFLIYLAYHYQSGLYGTFICDSYVELFKLKVLDDTTSLWSYILEHHDDFVNALYKPYKGILIPEHLTGRSIVFWKEYYSYFILESLDVYQNHAYTSDNVQAAFKELKEEYAILKQSQQDQEKHSLNLQQCIKQLQTIIYDSNDEDLINKLMQVQI